jgi:hypothetical protein
MSDHQFVAMWDCHGLEYLEDITDLHGKKVWAKLQGKSNDVRIPNLLHLELRARYNSQRHYEIYIFNAREGITKNDILEMFENNAQHAADVIRKVGHCHYSDRYKDNEVLIR